MIVSVTTASPGTAVGGVGAVLGVALGAGRGFAADFGAAAFFAGAFFAGAFFAGAFFLEAAFFLAAVFFCGAFFADFFFAVFFERAAIVSIPPMIRTA